MGLYLGGLIIGRIFASEIWGLIFGRLIFGGPIIGILRYITIIMKNRESYCLKLAGDNHSGFCSYSSPGLSRSECSRSSETKLALVLHLTG